MVEQVCLIAGSPVAIAVLVQAERPAAGGADGD